MDSIIRHVYEVLKTDNRKGVFMNLVNQDIIDHEMNLTKTEINSKHIQITMETVCE